MSRLATSMLTMAVLCTACGSPAQPVATATAPPTSSSAPLASPTSGPTASPTSAPTASPTSAPTLITLGASDRPLSAGTYRLDLPGLIAKPAAGSAHVPSFLLVTVPDGWNSFGGWIVSRPRSGYDIPPVAAQFWGVDRLYGHPCEWNGSLFDPGPTVDDLADAIEDIPLRSATEPVDITLDGRAGKYVEWSVPSDIEFADCDADGGTHYFESWTGQGWATDRYHQGPGQLDRLWILDVDGSRLVIDAFSMPYATDQEIAELIHVVESIRFED
jgi:hypothetical protein